MIFCPEILASGEVKQREFKMYLGSATSRLYLLMIWVIALATLTESAKKLKLCVVSTAQRARVVEANCGDFRNDGFECVIASDRIECLRAIVNGRADFAVFQPQDLFVAQSINDGHILVTHEFRLFPEEASYYEMVVLVTDKIRSLTDLHGKRFCHPGYDIMDYDWTPLFAEYLQNQIIPKKCEDSSSLLENRFAALSEWFKAACFPGPWNFSPDKEVERHLKSKYINMCAICNNGACDINDKYSGRMGAVMCLTEGDGDVAWVRLEDAKEYFKMEMINTSNYKFMCPDGIVRSLDFSGDLPCTWISRPWPVIGARSDLVERVARVIDGLAHLNAPWQVLLLLLIEGHKVATVKIDPFKTPEDYLNGFTGLSSAYAGSTCYPSRIIRWCLSSNLEDRKCHWLRRAALSYGLEPEISCLQQAGRNASIEGVAQGFCDFYIAQPEEFMIARKKNLTAILQLTSSYLKHFNNIAILVKKNSRYKKIEDLRGARACFTKYRSVAWNAFVSFMSNHTNDRSWCCSDEKAISTFFDLIVVPEADADEEKLIVKTFQCLLSDRGDVAFVSLREEFKSHPDVRRICVEDVFDPDCILTWSSLGSVMVNENLPQVRRREIISILEEMNTWFGVRHPEPTPAISLYEPYETHHNVIFPELTVNLLQNISHVQLPRPYSESLEQLIRIRSDPLVCGASSTKSYDSILISLIVTVLLNAAIFY
ncbi:transferrin [Diachasma alloeum]|uniref:transferrin n=1 Tax=Diachasma alloeum TaxID=454923 RepID=UPI0007384BB8|nr:transferrin [Diachasma alloeum]XP_015118897.1 transferrin [Diachasma alloeum]XP_028982254.1 transferrin [Diachasma alloeum]